MMTFSDIIESRVYEVADPSCPVIIRFGAYDEPARDLRVDNDEEFALFSCEGVRELVLGDLLEIDPDDLSEMFNYPVYVENPETFEFEEALDVFGDAADDGSDRLVIFSD